MVSEIWNICIAQTLKMIVLIFDNQTANDQRYPDIGHLENIAGNYLVGLSLDSSQVDKGARLELSFRWVKVLVWEKSCPETLICNKYYIIWLILFSLTTYSFVSCSEYNRIDL